MNQQTRAELFRDKPVKTAVLTMILPAVISQVISIVYNLADVFFVGQIGDPNKVAAISLSMPLLIVSTAIGNLFGIGGSSAISRALGEGDEERAGRHAAFCFCGALGVSALYSAGVLLFMEPLLRGIGARDDTIVYAAQYVRLVVAAGSVPASLSVTMSHMLRADGASRQSGFGLSMGGVVNILLDALAVMALGWGVAGAAAATLASNLLSCGYYFLYFYCRRRTSCLRLRPRLRDFSKRVIAPVLSAGVPASVQTFVVSLMYMMINRLASAYGGVSVAALGIVQKLDMIPQYVTLGISQGMIPLLGYNYAAKNSPRMLSALHFGRGIAVGFSLLCLAVFEGFAPALVSGFIRDAATVEKGIRFLRIVCVCCPFMAYCNTTNALFQATGDVGKALNTALFRRLYGGIPLLFAMNALFGELGIAWTQPLVDVLATFLVAYLYRRCVAGQRALERPESRL